LAALLTSSANTHLGIPPGIPWVGLAPVAIGLSHLVVYAVEKEITLIADAWCWARREHYIHVEGRLRQCKTLEGGEALGSPV
jgi:hypothetical protein